MPDARQRRISRGSRTARDGAAPHRISRIAHRGSRIAHHGGRMPDPHCGEVIAADTVHLEAECPRLYEAPNFGSFIRVDSDGLDIYGVVYHIATGCIDSNRRTQALGLAPDEIPRRMPHLDLVLRTTFSAR